MQVGQSLSIRSDLLSPGYIRGLETLQDNVPAFATDVAKEILEKEWGQPILSVLMDDLTEQPVAAASLGQVYKATLRATGEEVAIKVQRPEIMEKIALDMHLVREFAALLKRLVSSINTDLVGTVDAWGAGFIDELDYVQEAANGENFSAEIKETPLKDVVFAPAVVNDYSTRSVLVTSWVDGERLDRSSSDDVTVLCSIAMNTYLTMLLELGQLRTYFALLGVGCCGFLHVGWLVACLSSHLTSSVTMFFVQIQQQIATRILVICCVRPMASCASSTLVWSLA